MVEPRAANSIKRRLLLWLLSAVALIWLATALLSYLDAREETDELLDAHLAQSAALLIAQASHELEEIDTEHAPELHRYGRRVAFQIWQEGTVLRLHSAGAPNWRLSAQNEGFSDAEIEGRRWRVFSTWDREREILIQVAEEHAARSRIAASVARTMLTPLLWALPLLGLLIWASVGRATRPLDGLSRQVAQREPGNLAPLNVADAPAEVAPLLASLNQLFERVRQSIEGERRFTADAAHELRTPLAAIRAQAQVAGHAAAGHAAAGAECRRALDNVINGCDRAAHLVDQLLTLARLEPGAAQGPRAPCDLSALTRASLAELAPMALTKGVEVELSGAAAVVVAGDPGLLRILLRNVADNAIRYSPPHTVVRVNLGLVGERAMLAVEDQGPGVAPDQRERLGERFHRILGSDEPGSGLGLSIVKRIAELHQAHIAFSDGCAGRGLRVTVTFPARQH